MQSGMSSDQHVLEHRHVGEKPHVWNVARYAVPFHSVGPIPPMFSPFISIRPVDGEYTPLITLKTVVLPAPFGPIRLTIFALVDVEVKIVDRPDAAEDSAEGDGLQQVITRRSSFRSRPSRPSKVPRFGLGL